MMVKAQTNSSDTNRNYYGASIAELRYAARKTRQRRHRTSRNVQQWTERLSTTHAARSIKQPRQQVIWQAANRRNKLLGRGTTTTQNKNPQPVGRQDKNECTRSDREDNREEAALRNNHTQTSCQLMATTTTPNTCAKHLTFINKTPQKTFRHPENDQQNKRKHK